MIVIITDETVKKIKRSKVRAMKKEDGFFDGRFRTRPEKDVTKYSRKKKHKNLDY